jgi:hypothetical protein
MTAVFPGVKVYASVTVSLNAGYLRPLVNERPGRVQVKRAEGVVLVGNLDASVAAEIALTNWLKNEARRVHRRMDEFDSLRFRQQLVCA